MLTVTYVYHSCYVCELEKAVLIFDYYDDGGVDVKKLINKGKSVYVFSSHSHVDHYSSSVFDWQQEVSDIRYILSDDIKPSEGETKGADVTFVSPNNTYSVGDISVSTYESTDQGVAFVVHACGKTIYHAGDMHWWYWEERGETYIKHWGDKYKEELKKFSDEKIDVAFVILDPRLEGGYAKGMEVFFDMMDVKAVFPMHMWKDYDIANRFKSDLAGKDYLDKLNVITDSGDTFELDF